VRSWQEERENQPFFARHEGPGRTGLAEMRDRKGGIIRNRAQIAKIVQIPQFVIDAPLSCLYHFQRFVVPLHSERKNDFILRSGDTKRPSRVGEDRSGEGSQNRGAVPIRRQTCGRGDLTEGTMADFFSTGAAKTAWGVLTSLVAGGVCNVQCCSSHGDDHRWRSG